LSRPPVEFGGDVIEVVLAQCSEVGAALGEVLRSRPLLFSLLPRCQGFLGRRSRPDAAGDAEASVLDHLFALVPGD
jgi:hypothetical protein